MNSNSVESLLVFLFIGLVAGWLAGILVKGRGFGVLGDILVGVVGAQIGGWIFSGLGLSAYGFVGAVIMALVGAIALLTIIKLVVNVGSTNKTASVFMLLMACGLPAYAATTVIVDNNDNVTTVQPVTYVQTVEAPVIVTREAIAGDFEGRVVDIDYSRNLIIVNDIRNLDGRIMSVNASRSQIVIRSAEGKDNAVYVRQGQINNYRVGDNVRVYLLRDREQVQVIRVIR